MFKYISLAILIISSLLANNSSITGQISSQNGKPISYAIISDPMNEIWTISDEEGRFTISFPQKYNHGDSLVVSRYGYKSNNLILTEKLFYTIMLYPSPIDYKPISVEGSNVDVLKQLSNTYNHILDNNESINLLQQLPGMAIRSYGGKTGGLFLSTFGGPAVNTKVLIDNVDLTNAQFGSIDLTLLPESLINKLNVANSPSIFFGSGAVDGAINIEPRLNKTYVATQIGSFGNKGIEGNFFKRFKTFYFNFSVGYVSDDGNYEYQVDGKKYSRDNNDFERKYVAINTTIKLNDKSNLNGFFIESRQDRGVAGSISWPSPQARRENNLKLGNITYNRLSKNGFTRIQISSQDSKENFDDSNPYWPTSSNHKVIGNTISIKHNHAFFSKLESTILLEGKQETINSSDVGNHDRKSASFVSEFKYPIVKKFNIMPSIRIDKIGDNSLHTTYSAIANYTGLKNIHLEYILRTGFRAPTFNDLYWNPGGNPDLKPEISLIHSIKSKIYLNKNGRNIVYINITKNDAKDLIQWVPIDESFLVWQPQNVAKSRRTSLTVGSQLSFEKIPLQIEMHSTLLKSEDLDIKKAILYAPEIIGFVGMKYSLRIIDFRLQAHCTGERLSQYGLENDTYLEGYWYTSANVSFNTELLGNSISLALNVSNIFDKQYTVTSEYPEPGRNVSFRLIYTM